MYLGTVDLNHCRCIASNIDFEQHSHDLGGLKLMALGARGGKLISLGAIGLLFLDNTPGYFARAHKFQKILKKLNIKKEQHSHTFGGC